MSIVQTSELVQSEPNFGVRLITAVGVGVYILLFYEGNEVIWNEPNSRLFRFHSSFQIWLIAAAVTAVSAQTDTMSAADILNK